MSVDAPSPYKGLRAFEDSELDALRFFGREHDREVITANLLAARLTVLYGPSGVGKSSVLRAAVARQVRALPEEPVVVVFSSWAERPAEALAAAVADAAGIEQRDTLVDTVAEAGRRRGDVYVILDQAEELFLYGADGFAKEFPELVTRRDVRANVLLSVRDDALARLDLFKARLPDVLGNYLRLDRLDRRAGLAAILGPIARMNELANGLGQVVVEPALAEAVLDEVSAGEIDAGLGGRGRVGSRGEARIEAPYLQLVMQRLWEVERAAGSQTLRLETFRKLGGAQRIVADHLEGAVGTLSPAERDTAATLFHQLVTPSGTKIAHGLSDLAGYTKTPVAALGPVLDQLSERRIVRPIADEGGAEPRFEIFHDVLAGAVLAWRGRHETNRELERARAAAARRHRRSLAVIAFALVALAATSAVALYALSQRSEALRQTAFATAQRTEAERQAATARRASAEAAQQAAAARAGRASARAQATAAKSARNDARVQAERANDEAARANDEAARANTEAERAKDEEARANDEADRANREAVRADAERDEADVARADAVQAKNAEVIQRKNAERAFVNERLAKRDVVVSRDAARASALVSRAITLLQTGPERSLRLALRSAAVARAPRLEITLRDALKSLRVRFVLPGGGGPVLTASTSSDGSRVLVPSANGDARIFDLSTGTRLTTLRHGEPLTAAVFSPDGGSVLTGGIDGVVRRWDARSGALLGRSVHGALIREIAHSPDGRLFATAAGESARVWLAADGSAVARLPHQFTVDGVSFNPAGTLLMTLSRDARLFGTEDWQRPPIVLDQPGQILVARFAPIGPLVATGGRDDLAMVWDSRDGSKQHQFVTHSGDITDLAWSPTADRVATASSDNGGRVFRVDTGVLVTFLGAHSNQIVSIAFSPDGSQIATSSLDGTARIWGGGVNFARTAGLSGHSNQVLDVSFAPDGQSVVTASADGSARVWRTAVDPIMSLVGRHAGVGRAVAFSPDGSLIASVGLDRALRVWRRDGTAVRTVLQPAQLVDVGFSKDGALLVTAGLDGVARVVRVADWSEVQSFAHGAPLGSAVFDASGERVLTAGADGIARIWRRSGGLPRVFRHADGAVTAVFSPDGRFVATAGQNVEGRVWRAATSKLVGKLTGQHDDALTSIAYSPDGKFIATSSIDADGHIWNAATFKHERPVRGHSSLVSEIAFSPDGEWLATAGPTTVGMWERRTDLRIEQGVPLLFLRGHIQRVWGIAVAPDSRRVASISADGTVRTYLCEVCGTTNQLIRTARARLDRLEAGLTADEIRKHLGG